MREDRACCVLERAFARRLGLMLGVVVGLVLLALPIVGNEVYEDSAEPVYRADEPGFVPSYTPDVDEPILTAPHPPIEEIPAPRMPNEIEGTISDPEGPKSVFVHDAETGETRVYELEPASSGIGGSSRPGYHGVVDYEPEESLLATFGTMTVAGSLDSFPRSPNCRLIFRRGTSYWVCSGSMNDAGVVLTAAHCVYDYPTDWADEVWVYPAWDGVGNSWPSSTDTIENFGTAHGTVFACGTDYINNGNWDRDCGMIRLDDRNVGMLTGWFGWTWGYDCAWAQGHIYYDFSYPAENCPTAGLHTGRTMYYLDGYIDSCPNNQLQYNTGNQCTTAVWGGMSGSGLYWIESDYRRVHAICSTSDRSSWGRWCKLWEEFTTYLETFESDTRGTTFDLEALQFRSSGATTVEAGGSLPDCSVRICNATNANPGSATYTLRCYLSTNNNISTSDTLLGTWYYTMDFGAMHNSGWLVPTPDIAANTPAGTYWVGVVLDVATDSNFGNNDTDTWDAEQVTVTCSVPPSTPSWISASDGTYHQYVYVDWPAATGAVEYQVYRDGSNLSGWITATEYYDTTATPGPVYYYKVRARKACGAGSESAFSATNGGWRRVAPPTGVAATNGTYADKVRVTWNSVWGAGGYRVYRSDTLGGAKTAVGGWMSGLSYDDSTGDPFYHYYYWVRSAETITGSFPSDYSTSDTGWRAPTTAATFRVDHQGHMFADGIMRAANFVAGSADVAEWIAVSEPVEPGDVVELDPEAPGCYRLAASACSGLVAGVVSTEPGVVLGQHGDEGMKALLALTGIVAVKVTDDGGPIQPGDLLVSSSTPGHAMRWAGEDPCPCVLVGKALAPMLGERGVILVLLTTH